LGLFAMLFVGVVNTHWYLVTCLAVIAASAGGLAASRRIAPERYEFAEPATLGAVARFAVRNHAPPT
jgi:hypothetical protein